VSGVWLDVLAALVWTGAASKVMGVKGAISTVEALRGLRRRGWRLVNDLKLHSRSDIDHVAVGPGGVLVVETKWSGEPWPLNGYGPRFMEARMNDAAAQAAGNAKELADRLAESELNVPMTSIVALWTGADESGDGWETWRNGHTVLVHGLALPRWLRTELPQTGLTAETVERVWALLDKWVGEQDQADAQAGVIAPTVWSFTKQWLIKPLCGALAAAYAIAGLIRFAHDWPVDLASTVLAVVLGLWALKIAPVRQIALGWLVVSAVMLIAEIGVLIAVAVR
jgi:hypothetical protein